MCQLGTRKVPKYFTKANICFTNEITAIFFGILSLSKDMIMLKLLSEKSRQLRIVFIGHNIDIVLEVDKELIVREFKCVKPKHVLEIFSSYKTVLIKFFEVEIIFFFGGGAL